MPGHRVPAMRAPHIRPQQSATFFGTIPVFAFRVIDRAAGFEVDMRRPVDRREFVCRQQLSGQAIEHVLETVFRRNEQGFPILSADP